MISPKSFTGLCRAAASVAATTAALLCGGAQAAPVVAFNPSTSHANVGDLVTIDVGISGLGAEVLSAFDLDVLFNPAIVVAAGPIVFNGAALGGPWLFGQQLTPGVQAGDGNALTLDDDALAAVQASDTFVIMTLSFTALADGATQLRFGPDLDFERAVFGRADANGDAQLLNASFGTACIAVGSGSCAVPEPGSLALVGLALGALLLPPALRRRARPDPLTAG